MDLQEWEFLPVQAPSADDTFLDLPYEDDDHHAEFLKPPNQVVHVPVELDPVSHAETKDSDSKDAEETDQDMVSQVHFTKVKDTEFADMKIDSPKSGNKGSPSAQNGANIFDFEDKVVIMETKNFNPEESSEEDVQDSWEGKESGGLNILKWGLSGIGAICSFGVAAATVCIIALGSNGHKKNHHCQDEKLRFEIYKDKRVKEVVHHATEAITSVRGVPVDRTNIIFGGYYEYL